MTVLVLGSLNMDLVVQVPRLPLPGETLLGKTFETTPGGKGANQAIAVVRQQIPTQMIGRVGTDAFGHTLRHALAVEGVNVDAVQIDPTAPTGVAAIAVATNGANQIIVVPGANGTVDVTELALLKPLLATAHCLLLQLEIPLPIVQAAAELAQQAGVIIILDPAPVPEVADPSLLKTISILTPNQVEASQLVGFEVNNQEQAAKAAQHLLKQGCPVVIIKLGADGVFCQTADESWHLPAFPVPVVDTVAAGDAFNGGLAVALHGGKSLHEAVEWAAATAALSVTQPGAQPSMPTREQVDALLQSTHLPQPEPS
jgi:ribokinase